jgi:hypothetical protein
VHLKVHIPSTVTPRQKELLEEFDVEDNKAAGEGDAKAKASASHTPSGSKSVLEQAWNRMRQFMGKNEADSKK